MLRSQGADTDGDGFPDCDIGAFGLASHSLRRRHRFHYHRPHRRATTTARRCRAVERRRAGEAQRRIRFAFGVANVPPAQTAKVKLMLTPKGKEIAKSKRGKKLKGMLEITNAPRLPSAVRRSGSAQVKAACTETNPRRADARRGIRRRASPAARTVAPFCPLRLAPLTWGLGYRSKPVAISDTPLYRT
jgi:hypothetical protein